MRNVLWRVLAVCLAAVIGYLLWQWPAEPEPVEFELECTGEAPFTMPCEQRSAE